MEITTSLRDALYQLRNNQVASTWKDSLGTSLTQPLYFWIDAVCINQSDYKEKSFQVSRMADIYRQARKTIIWLGLADKSSDMVMDHIHTIGKEAEACGMEIGPDPYSDIWGRMASTLKKTLDRNQPNLSIKSSTGEIITISWNALWNLFSLIENSYDDVDGALVDGIQKVFTRPWWGRVWVLQEIALSDEVEIFCGSKKISRRRCTAFINAHYAFRNAILQRFNNGRLPTMLQARIFLAAFHHRPLIMLSSWRIYKLESFPLAALLRMTCVGSKNPRVHGSHHLESTNPRDKIFALLGLAADKEELRRMGIFPDYSKSKEDVYATTMVALLQQGHLSLLSLCEISKTPSCLPSWVPDWSRSVTHTLQDVENDHVTIYPTFQASGQKSPHPTITAIRESGGIQSLSITCHIYDKVNSIGIFKNRVPSDPVPLDETTTLPVEWLSEILNLSLSEKKRYETFEDRLRASTRTSIGGVGFGPDMRLTKIKEGRFDDAICLLQRGIGYVKPPHLKSRLEKFFNDRGVKKGHRDWAIANQRFGSEIIGKSLGRIPCITTKGHLALCSEHVEQGDIVALIPGVQVPFVLRCQRKGQYQIISEAYVDGVMDGEAVDLSQCKQIVLV